MKKIFLSGLLISSAFYTHAQQENDSIQDIHLRSVTISTNKFSEAATNAAQRIEQITRKQIKQTNAQTSADVLLNTGNVFVQKSQQGGGSPVIRGFEASRILLLVDGIRLNNAIYRAGHLQNIITVDPNALDKMEVMYGPSSAVHGSDALGGAIMMKTREAQFTDRSTFSLSSGNALVRYSSANQEKTGSFGFNLANRRWASVSQISYSDFGDLIQGKNGVDSIMNLWKKNFLIDRVNDKDTMIKNTNPYQQISTAYHQMDVLQKISFKQNKYVRHTLNGQLSNTGDIPRYDRLTETSNGLPKSAEWYYGPQFRGMLAYTMEALKMKGFFNDVTLTLSRQWIKESRHNRSFGSTGLNHREESIQVNGYTFAARHRFTHHELTIGTDGQMNNLTSVGTQENIVTGAVKKIDSRYPDGKNRMNLFGFYAQHRWTLLDGDLVISDGIRLDLNHLTSSLVDTSIMFRLPFLNIEQNNKALTGNIGFVYTPDTRLRFNAQFSRGFRTPNFDDLTKIFGSKAASGLIVPNTNLKPEFTNNVDLGITYQQDGFSLNVYGFYTEFRNAMVTDRSQYNGKDSVMYDGALTAVFTTVNKDRAFIYGGGFQMTYQAGTHFSVSGSSNYTYGRFNGDSVLVPLDHIAPVHGRISMKYDMPRWYAELYSLYNGKKRLVDYNPNGEDNLPYATPNGMPGWYTVNARVGIHFMERVQLQIGMENILDRNYRYFASGMSAPGRNTILALRVNY